MKIFKYSWSDFVLFFFVFSCFLFLSFNSPSPVWCCIYKFNVTICVSFCVVLNPQLRVRKFNGNHLEVSEQCHRTQLKLMTVYGIFILFFSPLKLEKKPLNVFTFWIFSLAIFDPLEAIWNWSYLLIASLIQIVWSCLWFCFNDENLWLIVISMSIFFSPHIKIHWITLIWRGNFFSSFSHSLSLLCSFSSQNHVRENSIFVSKWWFGE